VDWWPLRRFAFTAPDASPGSPVQPVKTGWQLILEKTPLFLLAACSSIVTQVVQIKFGAVSSMAALPLVPRLENALVSYCRYIKKLAWPVHLSIMYPLHVAWPIADLAVAAICLVAVSDLAIRFRTRYPYLLVGWLWYLGTLVPVIGIVQIGAQGMADRYSYIPSIGVFIMVCWGVFDLLQSKVNSLGVPILKSHDQWIPGGLCVATLAMCVFGTSNRIKDWRNGGTLFSSALAVDPNNYGALNTYGLFLCEHGSYQEALVELRRAVQINPNGSTGRATLGHVLYVAGEDDAAASELRIALKLKPDQASTHYDLGCVLLEKNLPDEAAAEFDLSLQYDPDDVFTHCQLGKALILQGRLDEALEQFSDALRLDPQFPAAHFQQARILAGQHKTTEAIAHYRKALSLQPAMPEALNNLAWILATDPRADVRDGAEAVQLGRRACKLTGNSVPVMIGTLAAACAEAGNFDEAIADAQKAHDLALAQGSTNVAAKNVELLELFRSHHAYHQ
jgi:protein O-mannosyl-transferase